MADKEERNTSTGSVNPGNPLTSSFPEVLNNPNIIASMAKALITTTVDGVKNSLGSPSHTHGTSFISERNGQTTGNSSGSKKGVLYPVHPLGH